MDDEEIAKLTTTSEFYVGLLLAVSSSRKFRKIKFCLVYFELKEGDSSAINRLCLLTLCDKETALGYTRSRIHHLLCCVLSQCAAQFHARLDFRSTKQSRWGIPWLIFFFFACCVYSFHRKQFHYQEEGSHTTKPNRQTGKCWRFWLPQGHRVVVRSYHE